MPIDGAAPRAANARHSRPPPSLAGGSRPLRRGRGRGRPRHGGAGRGIDGGDPVAADRRRDGGHRLRPAGVQGGDRRPLRHERQDRAQPAGRSDRAGRRCSDRAHRAPEHPPRLAADRGAGRRGHGRLAPRPDGHADVRAAVGRAPGRRRPAGARVPPGCRAPPDLGRRIARPTRCGQARFPGPGRRPGRAGHRRPGHRPGHAGRPGGVGRECRGRRSRSPWTRR